MRVQLDNTQSIIYIYVFVRERSSLKINYSCFETDFGEDFTRIDSFSAHISTPKLDIEDFVYISVICKATSVCVHSGALDLIYPGTSLYEHILWMHLEKKRTYACTFPVQRKEINVVKVRFTMRYSSRKLSHEKVITTACNLWRQIACSVLGKSGNVLLLGIKIFEIPPFFHTRSGDLGKKVQACSLRFSTLKLLCLSRESLSCDTSSLDLCILFKFIFLYLWYIPPHSCTFHTFYFTNFFLCILLREILFLSLMTLLLGI